MAMIDQLYAQVDQMFKNAGVIPAPGSVMRIAEDILYGRRTLQKASADIQWVKNYLTNNPDKATDPGGHRLAGGPPTDDATETIDTGNAEAIIRDTLSRYGLESLVSWAITQIKEGKSPNEVLIDLRKTSQYKTRFAGLEQRRANNLTAMTEEEYLQYELEADSLMSRAGMPNALRNRETYADLIGRNISLIELGQRINNGYRAVAAAPMEIRRAFADYFGPNGDSALAAFFIDPDRTEQFLLDAVEISQFGGTAEQFGFDVGRGTAEGLRNRGYSLPELRSRLMAAREQTHLTQEIISERMDLTDDTLLRSFGFDDVDARESLRRRVEKRIADFQGGGGSTLSGRGFAGFGSQR